VLPRGADVSRALARYTEPLRVELEAR